MSKWVCKNDKCEKPCYAEPPDTCCPTRCLLKDHTPNWQKADEPITSSSQLPKLTAEVFDRPNCPEWAQWAAVDENGKAYYFANKPKYYSAGYFRDLGWDAGHFMLIGDFDSSDWKNSLIERREENTLPKSTVEVFYRPDWLDEDEPATDDNQLPKLTVEVFNRENCPVWAKYAAVDKNGIAGYFSEYPSNRVTPYQWMVKEPGEYQRIDDYFDASDWKNSLIERPAKLPEWCTVDAMCWHKRCGYFKVTYIDSVSRRVDIQQVDDKSKGYLSFNTVCNDVCQAHIRKYNEKEMQWLVGKVIENDNFVHFINAFDKYLIEAVSGSDGYTASELLEFGYTINGEPCGKFEHLENGKWVE